MARWNDLSHRGAVLAAAEEWRKHCFFADGALFNDRPVWTLRNINDLHARVVSSPNWSGGPNFNQKLLKQLDEANPEVRQLAAEMNWFIDLISMGTSVTYKRNRIQEIMRLTNDYWLDIPYLKDEVMKGIARQGTAYNTHRYTGICLFLELLLEWKKFNSQERNAYYPPEAVWDFAEWCDAEFLGDKQASLRNALLYWLYPDSFERIVSVRHKQNIVRDFLSKLSPESQAEYHKDPKRKPLLKLDKYIFEIRQTLEEEYKKDELDFYLPPLSVLWFQGDKQKAGTPLENALNKDTVTEGDFRIAVIKTRKRTSQRKMKIRQFRNKNGGKLFCEACGCDAQNYPEGLRERIFEIHHIKNLSNAKGSVQVGLDDLAVICANCHRAIHAGDPPPTVEGLSDALVHLAKIEDTR